MTFLIKNMAARPWQKRKRGPNKPSYSMKIPTVKVLKQKAKAYNAKHHVKVSQKKSALYAELRRKGGMS